MKLYKIENKTIREVLDKEIAVTMEGDTLFVTGRQETSDKTNELILINTDKPLEEFMNIKTEDMTDQVLRLSFSCKEEVYTFMYETAKLYEIMNYEENNDKNTK